MEGVAKAAPFFGYLFITGVNGCLRCLYWNGVQFHQAK